MATFATPFSARVGCAGSAAEGLVGDAALDLAEAGEHDERGGDARHGGDA